MTNSIVYILTGLLTVVSGLLVADFCLHCRQISAQKKEKKDSDNDYMKNKKCVKDEKIVPVSGLTTLRREKTETVSKLDTGKPIDLDLMGQERPTFTLRLPPDGKELHLLVPTKAVADRFEEIGRLLERIEQDSLDADGERQLYRALSLILSHNVERCVLTETEIGRRLSPRDVEDLLEAYMEWILRQVREKN